MHEPRRNKILVLVVYRGCPDLFRPCLSSLSRANRYYEYWHAAILDASISVEAADVAHGTLPGARYSLYANRMTQDQEIESGGMMGYCLNRMIEDFKDFDIICYLEGHDQIHSHYFLNLDVFFSANKTKLTCYSHVCPYDPNRNPHTDDVRYPHRHYLNESRGPIDPTGLVELGQVAWRQLVHTQFQAWFPCPKLLNISDNFIQQLYHRTGPCPYSGFISHYRTEFDSSGPPFFREQIKTKLRQAWHLFNRNELLQARLTYEDVLKSDPRNAEAKTMLKYVAMRAGERSSSPSLLPARVGGPHPLP